MVAAKVVPLVKYSSMASLPCYILSKVCTFKAGWPSAPFPALTDSTGGSRKSTLECHEGLKNKLPIKDDFALTLQVIASKVCSRVDAAAAVLQRDWPSGVLQVMIVAALQPLFVWFRSLLMGGEGVRASVIVAIAMVVLSYLVLQMVSAGVAQVYSDSLTLFGVPGAVLSAIRQGAGASFSWVGSSVAQATESAATGSLEAGRAFGKAVINGVAVDRLPDVEGGDVAISHSIVEAASEGAYLKVVDRMESQWRKISPIYDTMRGLELSNKLSNGFVTQPMESVGTKIGLVKSSWSECNLDASSTFADLVILFSTLAGDLTEKRYITVVELMSDSLGDLHQMCGKSLIRSKELETSVSALRESLSTAKTQLTEAGELKRGYIYQNSDAVAIKDLQQSIREIDDGARSIVGEVDRVLHKISHFKRKVQASSRDLDISFKMLANLIGGVCANFESHPNTDVGRACSKHFVSKSS